MRCSGLVALLCACGASGPLEPPTGPVQQYVIRRELMPTTNTQAREYGLDLNGDKMVDNQLGQVFSTVAGMGIRVSNDPDDPIARGAFIQLAQVQLAAPSDPDDSVALSLVTGAEPSPTPCIDDRDTTCGRHLQGNASFVAEPSADAPLLGARRDRDIQVGPGNLRVTFSVFGEPATMELIAARARLDSLDPSALAGVLAGAVRHADIDTQIVPPFVRTLERLVASECPTRDVAGCGCPRDSEARTWLGRFDLNKDCSITADEIINNSLTVSLLSPDLTVDGEQLLSFGFRFEAVPATF